MPCSLQHTAMKAVIVLVVVCLGGALAGSFIGPHFEPKVSDKDFLEKQEKLLWLNARLMQNFEIPEYETILKDYSFEKYHDHYNNVPLVEEFWRMYAHGMLPKGKVFCITYEKMRAEAIALFHLFYYAKDFDTFYKSAVWARYHINEGTYYYALNVAVLHREDTRGIVLLPIYEVYPYEFINSEVINKLYRIQMQRGITDPENAKQDEVIEIDGTYLIYANYSGYSMRHSDETKISYFTEDVGLNSYHAYFHLDYPFWLGGADYKLYSDRRGELFYYFYQQLLARYYQERLTNDLGEIPSFSWDKPIETGYYPSLMFQNGYSMPMRQGGYEIPKDKIYDLQFVQDIENVLYDIIFKGYYKKSDGKLVDFKNPENIEFLANFFHNNPDYQDKQDIYEPKYYEIVAKYLLGGGAKPINDYYITPTALETYNTALRDPVFWQLYKRIINYFLLYKRHLVPYTIDEIGFHGVKIEGFEVDKLVTYFDYYDWVASNAVFYPESMLKIEYLKQQYKIRQPRLNHKPFTVKIDVSSDKEVESVVRIFFGPKYDSFGNVMSFNDNKYNFVEMDTFLYKLSAGKNTITRNSKDFYHIIKDRSNSYDIMTKILSAQKGTDKFYMDMSEAHNGFPHRLLLPKGTKAGYPFLFFVVISPHIIPEKPYGSGYDHTYYSGVGTGARYLDKRAFGYPLDRPIDETYFIQPNMYVYDAPVYHNGEDNVYKFANHHFYEGKWYGKEFMEMH